MWRLFFVPVSFTDWLQLMCSTCSIPKKIAIVNCDAKLFFFLYKNHTKQKIPFSAYSLILVRGASEKHSQHEKQEQQKRSIVKLATTWNYMCNLYNAQFQKKADQTLYSNRPASTYTFIYLSLVMFFAQRNTNLCYPTESNVLNVLVPIYSVVVYLPTS